ncbi:Phosphoesterase [Lachnospiraceae bacterium TWA4]|nr:Phosphoesterase [Lachnospiraceae bacterium TWA4]
MWRMIFIGVPTVVLIGLLYVTTRIGKLSFLQKFSRVWRFLISLLIEAIVFAGLYYGIGIINAMVVLLHVIIIWLLCDILGSILAKLIKKNKSHNWVGCIAIVVSIVYLCMGWYFGHHVYQTNYQVTTTKDLGGKNLKVVMFADSHVGATFHHEEFASYMEEIKGMHPDAVLIAGDFVDDDTSKEDMIKCCEALGNLNNVYFVFGNHDRGYFTYRDFNESELIEELEKNHVTILQDKNVLINNQFYLIGREDRSVLSRQDMASLIKDVDMSKFSIVMDHQPHDYINQEKSGVDLVLSGHTHGGWLFPINYLGEMMGTDDKTYGYEKRSNTNFIVTSGISDWALKFKTGCISEYVIVDIIQE